MHLNFPHFFVFVCLRSQLWNTHLLRRNWQLGHEQPPSRIVQLRRITTSSPSARNQVTYIVIANQPTQSKLSEICLYSKYGCVVLYWCPREFAVDFTLSRVLSLSSLSEQRRRFQSYSLKKKKTSEKVCCYCCLLSNRPASDTGSALPHPTGANSLSGPAPAVTFNNSVGGSGGSSAAGNSVGGGAGAGGSSSTPVNLPAVLKDRVPSNLRSGSGAGAGSRGPPPPVPPRSPKRVNITVPTSQGGVSAGPTKGDKKNKTKQKHRLLYLYTITLRWKFYFFFFFFGLIHFLRVEHDVILFGKC